MTRVVTLSFPRLTFRSETEVISKVEFVNVEDIYDEIIAVCDTTCDSWHDIKRIVHHFAIVQIPDRLASEVCCYFLSMRALLLNRDKKCR